MLFYEDFACDFYDCFYLYKPPLLFQVGPSWDNVVERIAKSRYQPLLLIYTNQNASPVPTETAPNTRVMAPGFSMTQGKGNDLTIYQSFITFELRNKTSVPMFYHL